jgi:hypothetical protein
VDKLRKIDDEVDARACLAAAAKSRMTLGQWARAHGVDGRSLHAWQMNTSRGARSTTRRAIKSTRVRVRGPRQLGLVELVPVASATRTARYVVTVGALALEFGDDCQDETIRRVLRVLRSC